MPLIDSSAYKHNFCHVTTLLPFSEPRALCCVTQMPGYTNQIGFRGWRGCRKAGSNSQMSHHTRDVTITELQSSSQSS